jgi:AcrR family transcriptional regulator
LPRTLTNLPSQREENKARTTRAIRQAAIALFAAKGYEATTIDEIVAKAGVSVRTFFRHFPSKESVLFYGADDWIRSLTENFLAQPRTMSDVDALRDSFIAAGADLSGKGHAVAFSRAVDSSPTLQGCELHQHRHNMQVLAQAIATRHGSTDPDDTCTLLATLALVIFRRARSKWLASPAGVDMGPLIGAEYETVRSIFQQ